ncbi:sigma-70 family RNA polymerase sigma factor [Mucilaginibacter sp.]|uniref:RNA polymerase sigma factor n=1 Tax=Mucilaginibacter sp. TaxID=1882438 RepID=UPI002624E11D|nr:sigma-70 family RNA polymerase sigma factor [Mucilaginibacter sp.]MDB4926405.1 polymerase sigma-70 factor [Mucilaginibacter sp.]
MNSTTLLTDEELWHAIIMDDARAFAALYNRYWKKLYKTAFFYLKDHTTAEEVLHDVFVVLWNRRHYLKIESFSNYVYITTRYHVYKQLKAARLSPIEYIEQYTEQTIPKSFNDAEEKLRYTDITIQLESSLATLPKRCREIFWLSRVENRSNEEIANQFGISKRTVENQITHALKHLRLSYRELSEMVLFMLLIIRL